MTDHVAIAHVAANGLTARVAVVVLRVGVWCVARSGDRQRPWQLVHGPSGATLHIYATKREAVRVCKRLGYAFGLWQFNAGFGCPLTAPAKLERISGREVERVG